jgi:hypothetical protein
MASVFHSADPYQNLGCEPLLWLIAQGNQTLAQSLTRAREFFGRQSNSAGLSEAQALAMSAQLGLPPIQCMDLLSMQATSGAAGLTQPQIARRTNNYALLWSDRPAQEKIGPLVAQYHALLASDPKRADQFLAYVRIADEGLAQSVFAALENAQNLNDPAGLPLPGGARTDQTSGNVFSIDELALLRGKYQLVNLLESDPAGAVKYLQNLAQQDVSLAARIVIDLQNSNPRAADHLLRETLDRAPEFWSGFTARLQGSRGSQGTEAGFLQAARIHTPVILHTTAPDGSIIRTNELPELGHESIYFAAIKQGGDIPEMIVLPGPGATTLDGGPVRGRIAGSPANALDQAVQMQLGGEGQWTYVRFVIGPTGVVRAGSLDVSRGALLDLPLAQPIADAMQRPVASEGSGLPYCYPANWVRPLQASGYLQVVASQSARGPDELARSALRSLVGLFGITDARATLRDLAQLPNSDVGMAVAKDRFIRAVLPALPEEFSARLFNDAHAQIVRGAGLSARAQTVLRAMVIALIRDPASLDSARAAQSRQVGASAFEALEREIHQSQLNTTGAPSFLNAARAYKDLIADALLPNLRR